MQARYDLTSYDNRAERMELLHDRDFDRYFALLDAARDAYRAAAREILACVDALGCVAVSDGTRVLYVHRSLYRPGAYQATRCDDLGPIEHSTVTGADDLADDLPRAPFACIHP